MYKEQNKQTSFFGDLIYNQAIPKEHFLRKLSEVVDFSFVNEICEDLYCPDNGRPCWEPQVIFKAIFLQFLYDLSDYDIVVAGNSGIYRRQFFIRKYCSKSRFFS